VTAAKTTSGDIPWD